MRKRNPNQDYFNEREMKKRENEGRRGGRGEKERRGGGRRKEGEGREVEYGHTNMKEGEIPIREEGILQKYYGLN